jgi:ABC-type nitrate/sulfonate/bicarbonate transport system substrate-binding protein
MMTMKGKLIVTVVILLVAGIGVWRFKDTFFPQAKPIVPSVNVADLNKKIDNMTKTVQETAQKAAVDVTSKLLAGTNKAVLVDNNAIPALASTSAYTKHTKNGKTLVRFPINIWPGWAPIIVANNGMAANDESLFYKEGGFYVEIFLVDNPVQARDLFASGDCQILWGTLDMMAMFAPALTKDSRTVPVIAQQVDWSCGGDGIVARHDIKSVNDLRMKDGIRKKVVLAQNSPSHYFIMVMLLQANIDPAEIDFRWTADAPSAAKLFVQDTSFDAFVGWSPDIYTVADSVPGTRIIVNSSSANHVIADVWAVRNDFYKDNPNVVQGLVNGIFKGMELVRKDPKKAAQYLSAAYNIPVEDCQNMIGKDGGVTTGDAHLTNYRENNKFFLDTMNPANFEAIWNKASTIYQTLGTIDSIVAAAKVKEPRIVANLAAVWKDSVDLSQPQFNPNMVFKSLEAGDSQILTKAVQFRFEPGRWNLNTNYDANIGSNMVEIVALAASFGNAYVVIEGNTDASMRGLVPADQIMKLSYDRADSVKQEILKKCPQFDQNKFKVVGRGWDNPLPNCTDPTNKDHNKANRRTEVKIYPLEQ